MPRSLVLDGPRQLRLSEQPARPLRPGEIRLRARRAGDVRLAVRFTPYWRLARGEGCVARTADDRTRLRLRAGGEIRLVTTFAIGRIGARSPRCT